MGSITRASKDTPTAVVKGAGPAGLASALSLAHLDFDVIIVEKRAWRPAGSGRRNMVALRPEALRVLEDLGALKYLVERGLLTDMVDGITVDEWLELEDGRVFDWKNVGFVRFPHRHGVECEGEGKYVVPAKLTDQLPSSFVDLGDLEDAMLGVCDEVENVRVVYEATVELGLDAAGAMYQATLVEGLGTETEQRHSLGCPDIIVCASGKNDEQIARDLGFTRRKGVKLDEDCLPVPGSLELRLGEDGQLEKQLFSVFGVRNPQRQMGIIDHVWRKEGTGEIPQPLCEIEMTHKEISHCLLHLPRDMDVNDKDRLEQYIVDRVNAKLNKNFQDLADMGANEMLATGDPLQPVVVESSTAPKFAYGSNVVLVGDAAMCCSPSSGIGGDIGMTADSQSVRQLGTDLITSRNIRDQHEKDKYWLEALEQFNYKKAEAAVMWSQASKKFYISVLEAGCILERLENAPGSSFHK